MDNGERTGELPQFEATPEARPLNPSAEAVVTSATATDPSTGATSRLSAAPAASQAATPLAPHTSAARSTDGNSDSVLGDQGREVVERLKPVAVAAEEVASKAVDLSVKGLSMLSTLLDRRRQARQRGNRSK